MKIRQVGVEMFHEDGRTDRRANLMKLIVAFRNFADGLKIKTRRALYTIILKQVHCNTYHAMIEQTQEFQTHHLL